MFTIYTLGEMDIFAMILYAICYRITVAVLSSNTMLHLTAISMRSIARQVILVVLLYFHQ